MKNKLLSIFALALLPASLAVPQSASAAPSCVGSECEVIFLYTGGQQTFSPPENATNLRFEVFGAAGGGNGGGGGKVAGTLTTIPETLYIYVGGAGEMGSSITGGFNGGGSSGGDAGNEGSGGGASDIRTSPLVESRIVVAGGGGGGGGKAGGAGGNGGNQIASHGASGQATGGGGATQTEGGFAGVSNGGYLPASAGVLGIGGSGASSTHAGGGGGGGGYFGGGGGGADDNTCCSDGGGGGGGSSFADTQYTTGVIYMSGVSWGHGWVTLKYTLAPKINYLEVIQATKTRLSFSIEGSESLSNLSQDELLVSGKGCFISYFTTDGILGFGSIHGCQNGDVTITVKARSFGKTLLGPTRDVSASTYFDATGPVLTFLNQEIITSASDIAIPFTLDEGTVSSQSFLVQGCETISVAENQILLGSCAEGQGSLTLLPLTLKDIWQNQSPLQASTVSFLVDRTGPVGSWSGISMIGDGPFSYSAALNFGEPVSFPEFRLDFLATASCERHHELTPSEIKVQANCLHTDLSWSFTGTVVDQLGNQSSFENLTIAFSNPAPTPPEVVELPTQSTTSEMVSVPDEPQPAPISTPVEPETAAEPVAVVDIPIAPTPVSSESSEIDVVSEFSLIESEPIEIVVVGKLAEDLVPASAPWVDSVLDSPEFLKTEVSESEIVAVDSPVEPELLIQPVLAQGQLDKSETGEPAFPWLPALLVLGLGVLGFGAWRFSGR